MSQGEILERIISICNAPEREQEQGISMLIADPICRKAITGITERYRNANRIERSHFDDLRQVITTETWLYLRELVSGRSDVYELRNFWGMLYRRCANAVQHYVAHEVHHFGGMSAQIRTHQEYSRFIARQRAAGVNSGETELIAQFNHGRSGSAQMTLEKARQGLPRVSYAEDSRIEVASREHAQPDDDFLLHPHEGEKAVKMIVDSLKATTKDAETAHYAELWLGGFYRGDGEVLPVTHIAELMGISRHRARTLQRKVREQAQLILKNMLGISANQM